MLTDFMTMLQQPLMVLVAAIVLLPGLVRGLAASADWLEQRVEHNARLRDIFHRLG